MHLVGCLNLICILPQSDFFTRSKSSIKSSSSRGNRGGVVAPNSALMQRPSADGSSLIRLGYKQTRSSCWFLLSLQGLRLGYWTTNRSLALCAQQTEIDMQHSTSTLVSNRNLCSSSLSSLLLLSPWLSHGFCIAILRSLSDLRCRPCHSSSGAHSSATRVLLHFVLVFPQPGHDSLALHEPCQVCMHVGTAIWICQHHGSTRYHPKVKQPSADHASVHASSSKTPPPSPVSF